MRKKVVIAQHRLLHYRVKFFEQLREQALAEDIDLHLLHGQASPEEARKKDTGTIDWAEVVTNRYWRLGGTDVLWQPTPCHLWDADLFVLLHQNRILSNYPIMLRQRLAGRKVAFWGHGANFQSTSPSGLRERWKRWQIDKVDFWFAYTEVTVELLRRAGIPDARMITLNNAVDTSEFRAQCEVVTPEEIEALRAGLGIAGNDPVAVFCGSLYPEKRLDLLVAAGDIVRARLPGFHLVVIGSGPSLAFLTAAARERPWLHTVGIRMGAEKARYFRMAQVMLNPGLLGLHILDAFCTGLPLVSTRNALHSPEIAYLRDGETGFLTEDTPAAYAGAVLRILGDPDFSRTVAGNALQASRIYTLEAMVDRFMDGLRICLSDRPG